MRMGMRMGMNTIAMRSPYFWSLAVSVSRAASIVERIGEGLKRYPFGVSQKIQAQSPTRAARGAPPTEIHSTHIHPPPHPLQSLLSILLGQRLDITTHKKKTAQGRLLSIISIIYAVYPPLCASLECIQPGDVHAGDQQMDIMGTLIGNHRL